MAHRDGRTGDDAGIWCAVLIQPIQNPALWPHSVTIAASNSTGETNWAIIAVGVGLLLFGMLTAAVIALKRMEAKRYNREDD